MLLMCVNSSLQTYIVVVNVFVNLSLQTYTDVVSVFVYTPISKLDLREGYRGSLLTQLIDTELSFHRFGCFRSVYPLLKATYAEIFADFFFFNPY